MSHAIHIDDLKEPVLTEEQKGVLAFGEAVSVELSADSILTEARSKTGMSDFGEDDFYERLELLTSEWNNDTMITGIGRMSLHAKLVTFASSRLLIQNTLKKHPEILDIPIEKPIIVAGLPRSGTTHLLNLMAADSRLRSLPLWESYEPIPLPGDTVSDRTTEDPRYQRCAEQWQMMQQVTPHLAAMHPMNPDHIHEELELMGPDFASYNFEWLCMSPRWRDHYYATDQTTHYEYMKNVLKILLWQQRQTDRPSRWVLKCPQHLEQLRALKQVFPDATVVMTHRDPVAVIQSTVTMLAYGQRINRRRVETKALIDYWSDRIEHLLRACVRDRNAVAPECSIDVPFHQFMADDMGMIENIYAKADLPFTEQAKTELQSFIDNHPRGKHGQVVYHLQRDFDIDPEQLRKRFEFYFQTFPIVPE